MRAGASAFNHSLIVILIKYNNNMGRYQILKKKNIFMSLNNNLLYSYIKRYFISFFSAECTLNTCVRPLVKNSLNNIVNGILVHNIILVLVMDIFEPFVSKFKQFIIFKKIYRLCVYYYIIIITRYCLVIVCLF